MYKTFILITGLAITAGIINSYAASGLIANSIPSVQEVAYRYVIKDCYTSYGESVEHKVDHYVRNVDGSISFNTTDGKSKTIPYPYFSVNTADGNLILY